DLVAVRSGGDAVEDRHLGADAGERVRDRAADAGGAARDHGDVAVEAELREGIGPDQNPFTYGSFPAVVSIAAPASSSTAVESHVPLTSWLRGPSGTVALITRSPKRTSCFSTSTVTGACGVRPIAFCNPSRSSCDARRHGIP